VLVATAIASLAIPMLAVVYIFTLEGCSSRP
jgi:hypothetical protein